jgi:hypothetical protein
LDNNRPVKRVKGPTLPINISKIKIIFPAGLKVDVFAILSPTVLNADTDSNNRCTGFLSGSETKRQKNPITITSIERKMIARTLLIVPEPISLFPITRLCRPLILLYADLKATANVVVFIPPPVDPGEAPIHIRNIIRKMVGYPQSVMSTILKPAVLELTLPKKDTISF